jgi:voltage-dependent potassium channel beta subunit
MEYRYLGRSGLKVSALSFGSWVTFGKQVDDGAAHDCMVAAYDAGANFFDNAEAYASGQSEVVMGNILKKVGWARDAYVVSTKIFWGGSGPNQRGLSRKHIVEGTNAALRRLQLDYVDLLFCHRPDVHTPIEETVRAMNHVIDQGKAFYWGTSEWSAQEITEAHHIARQNGLIAPLMEQPQYNMFHRERFEREYAPLYDAYGMGTTIWSPLASGLLTGKYKEGVPAGTRSTVEGMEWLRNRFESEEAAKNIAKGLRLESEVAKELGCSIAQLAIAWCAKNPNVSTVITGASRAEQVRENMKAMSVVPQLTPEVMERIESILDNRPKAETDWRA